MSDIFLSYAREDRARAAELASALTRLGWTVWWDRKIAPGQGFRNVISTELAKARCVIVLWSHAAVESDWVHEEAEDARERRVLVPVLLERIQPPLGFRQHQSADLSNWPSDTADHDFDRLVEGVSLLVPKPSSASQAVPGPVQDKGDISTEAGEPTSEPVLTGIAETRFARLTRRLSTGQRRLLAMILALSAAVAMIVSVGPYLRSANGKDEKANPTPAELPTDGPIETSAKYVKGLTSLSRGSIVIVRHAERTDRGAQSDPGLSETGRARARSLAELLKDAGISAIFSTELRRTQETADPLAKALGLPVTVVPAADTEELQRRVVATSGTALVVGHSNTIPDLLRRLGLHDVVTIGEEEFDNLFIVSPAPHRTLLRERYR